MNKTPLLKNLKKRKKLNSCESMLIDAIWKSLGGPAFIKSITGFPIQTTLNWRLRGKVPLEKVGLIARAFNIPKYGLNYEDLKSLEGDAPSWKEVVKSYKFSKKVESEILKFNKED